MCPMAWEKRGRGMAAMKGSAACQPPDVLQVHEGDHRRAGPGQPADDPHLQDQRSLKDNRVQLGNPVQHGFLCPHVKSLLQVHKFPFFKISTLEFKIYAVKY